MQEMIARVIVCLFAVAAFIWSADMFMDLNDPRSFVTTGIAAAAIGPILRAYLVH